MQVLKSSVFALLAFVSLVSAATRVRVVHHRRHFKEAADTESSSSTVCAGNYGQCGGKGMDNMTCCGNYECTFNNEYYSQCTPMEIPNDPNKIGPYGQCGGYGYDGPTTCQDTLTCVSKGDYYSMCVPEDMKDSYTSTSARKSKLKSHGQDVAEADDWHNEEPFEVSIYGDCTDINAFCQEGSDCIKMNDYYWQCVPQSNPVGLPVYSQCDGWNYVGPRACQAGTSCVYLNDYYSQCQWN